MSDSDKAQIAKCRIEERGLYWWFHQFDNMFMANIRIRPDSRTIATGYGFDNETAVINAIKALGNATN